MAGNAEDSRQRVAEALGLAESAWAGLWGRDRAAVLDQLACEYERLVAVLDLLIEQQDADGCEVLIRALRDLWWHRGQADAGQELIRRVLALPRLEALDPVRGALLDHAGVLAIAQDDAPAARRHFESSLAIRRQAGSPAQIAAALHHMASVIRWKLSDDRWADDLYQEALTYARSSADQIMTAAVLMPLGTLALDRGDLPGCRARLTEGLELFRDCGQPLAIPVALEQFAALAIAEGHPGRAVVLAAAGAAQRQLLGATQWPEMQAWTDRHLAAARRALTSEETAAAKGEGSAMTSDQAIRYALS